MTIKIYADRKSAREAGIKMGFYLATKPCAKCGSLERLYPQAVCSTCHGRNRTSKDAAARELDRERREAAIASGAARYEGKPCIVCSHTLRQTTNSRCIHCNLTNNRTMRKEAATQRRFTRTNETLLVIKGVRPTTLTTCYNLCPQLVAKPNLQIAVAGGASQFSSHYHMGRDIFAYPDLIRKLRLEALMMNVKGEELTLSHKIALSTITDAAIVAAEDILNG